MTCRRKTNKATIVAAQAVRSLPCSFVVAIELGSESARAGAASAGDESGSGYDAAAAAKVVRPDLIGCRL
ncbi:hypothetical protein [Paenibacillus eucommiae]|uniref:Uncharacterized protein n=1 Tax=Paenibacillus eucommiae TaxID=1355755 RepID=A0ABS4J390_9BACL|nr:hypothetical protein [Paenibacillus eucommiae]MBP1994298.1 hypothetical protein [Paenibacillus eucommiae]